MEGGLDDWVSAEEVKAAVAKSLGSRYYETVCKRAHAGMIKALAARVVIRDRSQQITFNHIELPAGFWWAEGGDAMDRNWTLGDFSCRFGRSGSRWDNVSIHKLARPDSEYGALNIDAFGVQFDREGAALFCSDLAARQPVGEPLSIADANKFFAALKIIRDEWTEPAADCALQALFPGRQMSRERLRDGLKNEQLSVGRGRPPKSPETDGAV